MVTEFDAASQFRQELFKGKAGVGVRPRQKVWAFRGFIVIVTSDKRVLKERLTTP